MRVVVTGASGNVGTSLIPLLQEDPAVGSIVGLARRIPDEMPFPGVEWVAADVSSTKLEPLFTGADVVVHLAWAIQPSHDEARLWATNVLGSRRVFDATAAAGVGNLVYASSVGAYSAGPSSPSVDESWPVEGTPTSFYARHKATVEWILDRFEEGHPDVRAARVRPALIFKREAAGGIKRLFLGPLIPHAIFRPKRTPILPLPAKLTFQAVHSHDVARAIHSLTVRTEVGGAYNLAAEPVLGARDTADILQTRHVDVPLTALRLATSTGWRLRAQPTPPGWIDMAMRVPKMDSGRAARDLGWEPVYTARGALEELIDGLGGRQGFPTPPLRERSWSLGNLRDR